jgi:hypothetical protein
MVEEKQRRRLAVAKVGDGRAEMGVGEVEVTEATRRVKAGPP